MVTQSRDPQPAPQRTPPSRPVGVGILGLDQDPALQDPALQDPALQDSGPQELGKKNLRIAYAGLIIFVATLLWMAFALLLIRRP